ncbi:MAG: Eco57I restriction-modification methylase domain-containing protein, partial [Chitinophagales bacterium]
MKLQLLPPNKSLNKAYLKEKVSRNDIETFKTNLITLLSKIDNEESEEHHKYPVADFLKDIWYKDRYEINTKGRTDFVIHNGKTTSDTVGVIIEVKSPSNQSEMISAAKPNKKAMHELMLYYLRERVDENQVEVKRLVITNILEWYIFDEAWFEKNIYRSRLKKEYENYKHSGKDTKFFFDSLAKPFLDELTEPIPCTHFDFRDYEKIVRNDNKKDDNKLIALYKLLSPAHLLKQPFANDSNSLDTKFYAELLHIIGLEEVKDGGKKLIQRKEKPDTASLLESAIMKLEDKDCLRNITNLSAYGAARKEQLFNVALELCITWINRVLFIKLLEGQLVTYHKGNKDYLFLNTKVVFDYDELNNLFFQVLAERAGNRHDHLKEKFSKIPYLNSSLFDRTPLERQTIEIGALDNRLELPIAPGTVLKNEAGKKKTNKLQTLQYLFDFLDAYDFSSDGGEEIQEENKNLINAAVLGLIFEKINGYKDGSFFTPGFVTMYMCRETIRRAVLQKFNEAKGWQCETIEQLYDKITDKKEANTIINSLKICDPAVGSGHFLVSALNEVIAIKSELHILLDRHGKTLRDYHVEVVNDELVVTDEDGNLLDYNPRNKESQRIQESLFHEKETIIENCLFGVDINPNSVKICRLRLWIELLKNAYYTEGSNFTELETLPNIDINIKCGNSLISRFVLDADIKDALKKSKWNIDTYKIAVQTYREAETKEQKREMEDLIETIKKDFTSEITRKDPLFIKLLNKRNQLLKLTQTKLFDADVVTSFQWKLQVERINKEIEKIESDIQDVKDNKIYANAFEWRFEFPEVLDNGGNFIGFDVVIGNPPYGIKFNQTEKTFFANIYSSIDDIYTIFIEKGIKLTKDSGYVSLIIPIFWLTGDKYFSTRKLICNDSHLELGVTLPYDIFADAYVDTGIYIFSKNKNATTSYVYEFEPKEKIDFPRLNSINKLVLRKEEWATENDLKIIFNPISRALTKKINKFKFKIGEITDSIRGILANDEDYATAALNNTYKPIFVGKIDRYFIESDKYCYIKYGDNLKERPSSYDYFTGERIIVRRIISRQFRIMATLTDKQFVT